jgi:cyclomaltodextrinase / maltogenic alpha-amylase / neopullulanase
MKDFIFGTLATEELRLKHVRTHRAGVSHSQARFPRDPFPGQEITLELSIGPDHICEQAWVYWTNDGSDPIGKCGIATNGNALSMETSGVEWDTVLWGYIRHFRAAIPGQTSGTVIRYFLTGISPSGAEIIADNGTLYACFIAEDPTPNWTQDAIVYQIFVDRFYPGKGKKWLSPQTPAGFYGGTLKGILDKLDYLCDLGVNVLWLTPIFPSPSHHGYDATDLFDIEPRLGTKRDLRILLDESHRRNMRILLDLVPNHVSNLHPTFQSALADKDSSYHNWYTFTNWPEKYCSFFDVPDLPQLNLRDPSTRQHMLDAVAFWLDFGVDGYRVDYAIGPAPDFWADFRKVTYQTRPDSWTFGEVVEPPDAQLNFEGGLDGCLDFNLMEAFRKTFAYSEWNAETFANFLTRHEAFFPEGFSRPSFLDNHDMNRFLWAAQGDLQRLRLAALCQFTLSGPPVIYYGTEVGLSQARDVRQDGRGLPEESRLPMLWGADQDTDLLVYYRHLIHLRRSLPALKMGRIQIVKADSDKLAYTRGDACELLVVLNLTTKKQKMDTLTQWDNILLQTNKDDVQESESGITMVPLGGAIISKRK